MGKIVPLARLQIVITKLKNDEKTVVLTGGCFDILHIGHIIFLEHAKAQGDILIVMLESDEQIKKYKGSNRPFNTQDDRSRILAALSAVDYVILLSPMYDNKAYDDLVSLIKPAIIATTEGDSGIAHKKRQAAAIGANLITVTSLIKDQSTSRLAKLLKNENL